MVDTNIGANVEADYKVMNDLIRLSIMPFQAVRSTCGTKTVRTSARDHYKQYMCRSTNYKCRHKVYRIEESDLHKE
eukprot:5226718-Amphidinium_carterae.2